MLVARSASRASRPKPHCAAFVRGLGEGLPRLELGGAAGERLAAPRWGAVLLRPRLAGGAASAGAHPGPLRPQHLAPGRSLGHSWGSAPLSLSFQGQIQSVTPQPCRSAGTSGRGLVPLLQLEFSSIQVHSHAIQGTLGAEDMRPFDRGPWVPKANRTRRDFRRPNGLFFDVILLGGPGWTGKPQPWEEESGV